MNTLIDQDQFARIESLLNEVRDIGRAGIQQINPVHLQQAFDEFLSASRARQLSIHTISDYSHSIEKFISHVGDVPMNDITSSMVTAFLATLPHSAKTVLNYHVGLAALWTWALKQGYVAKHIVRMVDAPRPAIVVIEPYTEAEIRALLGGIRQNADRDRAIIYLLLDTGMRASELVGIEQSDISFERRNIKVLGKGNKQRLLPFSKTTALVLSFYLESVQDRPFPMTRSGLRLLMRRLGKRSGVSDCHPHRFRHTFAITYLRNGGDIYTLQAILGHTTLDMIRRYLAIAQVDIEKVHQRASPVENWSLQPIEEWIRREPAQ
jgi:site-specific recombinase XerD